MHLEIEAQILEWEFQFIKEKKKVRKKERKHVFDQENDPEKNENRLPTKKAIKKKRKTITVKKATKKKRKKLSFFLNCFLVESVFFLSFFLTFLFSFTNSHLGLQLSVLLLYQDQKIGNTLLC